MCGSKGFSKGRPVKLCESTSVASQQLCTILPAEQVLQVNEAASLRSELDGLKKMMVDLQKQKVELHKVIMTGATADADNIVETTADSSKETVVDGSVGANKSDGNSALGTSKANSNGALQEDGNLLADIGEVGHLLALVLCR